MASILNYLIDSLDDFMRLAEDAPFRATLSVVLIASLLFSTLWAGWIARLQQSRSLNVTSIYDTIQGTNSVNRPPGSSSIIQPPPRNLGYDDTRPNRGRASFSSTAGTVPKWPYRELPGPIGFPISSPELSNLLDPRGPMVVGPPLWDRDAVSFYPSTSPSYRGKSVPPHFWPIFGTEIQAMCSRLTPIPIQARSVRARLTLNHDVTSVKYYRLASMVLSCPTVYSLPSQRH